MINILYTSTLYLTNRPKATLHLLPALALYTYIIDRQISYSILHLNLLSIGENEGLLDVIFLDLQELIQGTMHLIIFTRLDF